MARKLHIFASLIFYLAIANLVTSPLLADNDEAPRFVIHLLDYLANDYGGAVKDGKVLSDSEYAEQVEFANLILQRAKASQDLSTKSAIIKGTENLKTLIEDKASADKVAVLARSLQGSIIKETNLEISPKKWPNQSKVTQLFHTNCSACHGDTGHGDGPGAKGLDPAPADFHSTERMVSYTPFQAYNVIRFGVPGTGMASQTNLSDDQVWGLAFYVLSLRHREVHNAADLPKVKPTLELLKQTSTSSDIALLKIAQGQTEEEKNRWVAAVRMLIPDDKDNSSLAIARTALKNTGDSFRQGDFAKARANALRAYLDGIEPIEQRLKASSPEALEKVERTFANLRNAVESRSSLPEVDQAVLAAESIVDEIEGLLGQQSFTPWVAFVGSAAVVLREGFEAVLIVATLLSVIRASGSTAAAFWVHGGWIAAVGLGIFSWFFSGFLLSISGASREAMEGFTSLFAVGVLLVVGFWLHQKTELSRWHKFIHERVRKALATSNLVTLASISFISVFREAFETVIFLRALLLDGNSGSSFAVISGVLIAFVVVLFLAWLIVRFSARLPLRKLFGASALIMAFLAVVLTGKGLHALQEAGYLSVTPFPIEMTSDIIGLFGTWETSLLQLFVILLIVALGYFGRRPLPKPETVATTHRSI